MRLAVLAWLFTLASALCVTAALPYTPFDINGDGNTDIADAVALLSYVEHPDEAVYTYPGDVDFDENGIVDEDDAKALFLYSMYPDDYPIADHTVCYTVSVVVGNSSETQTVVKNHTAILPQSPTSEDGTFLYWSMQIGGEDCDAEHMLITADTVFYAVFQQKENDKAMITALQNAKSGLTSYRTTNKKMKAVKSTLLTVINGTLEKAKTEYITSEKVKTWYREELLSARKTVEEDMTPEETSEFIGNLAEKVDDDALDLLLDYFLDEATREKVKEYL